MRIDRMLRTLVPLAVVALGASGCSSGAVSFNGREGVPLAELDLAAGPPREIALMGPDRVIVERGDAFDVSVEGGPEQAEHLRFVLADGALGILRERGFDVGTSALSTIRVTLPEAPAKLMLAGSGQLRSDALAPRAEVSVAGSGSLDTPRVASEELVVSIAGSGFYRAAGRVGRLEVNIAGSGDANLDELEAERVEVSIAGSGNAVFASDGTVSASIMGSGDVTVRGDARCTVNAMGSGTLTCERRATSAS